MPQACIDIQIIVIGPFSDFFQSTPPSSHGLSGDRLSTIRPLGTAADIITRYKTGYKQRCHSTELHRQGRAVPRIPAWGFLPLPFSHQTSPFSAKITSNKQALVKTWQATGHFKCEIRCGCGFFSLFVSSVLSFSFLFELFGLIECPHIGWPHSHGPHIYL